jgi:hypothetical protein
MQYIEQLKQVSSPLTCPCSQLQLRQRASALFVPELSLLLYTMI